MKRNLGLLSRILGPPQPKYYGGTGWLGGTTGSASDQHSTNDRKVAGLRPTKVVCITVLTGNRME